MYFLGEGVEENYNQAKKWYEKSANQGNSDAQISLGLMYEKGIGVKQDHTKAQELYNKAGAQDQLKKILSSMSDKLKGS